MKYSDLKEQIEKCRECKEKFGFEPRPVVFGKETSKIMQISQAPSLNVYKTMLPFNDASGRKLRNEWYKITDEQFYNTNNFYIVSLAHCYPGKNKNGGDNLPPKICSKMWLEKEIELVDCKMYVIIGALAAKYLFKEENFNDLVFKDNILNGNLALVLPHPSPLNIKWFKDNKEFLEKRIFEIRKYIKDTIDNQ